MFGRRKRLVMCEFCRQYGHVRGAPHVPDMPLPRHGSDWLETDLPERPAEPPPPPVSGKGA